jgi:hypothetical protein
MNSHDSIIEPAKVLCLAKIRSAFELNNIRFSFRGVLAKDSRSNAVVRLVLSHLIVVEFFSTEAQEPSRTSINLYHLPVSPAS